MKTLQIVDHNINIGHCKIYYRDFVTNILWFIKLLNFEFRIPNSEPRIPNSELRIPNSRNSDFPNSALRKEKMWMVIWFFGDATSGSVHRVGQGIQN